MTICSFLNFLIPFTLGLGIPKSFSILYAVLLVFGCKAIFSGSPRPPAWVLVIASFLFLFGFSYAGAMVWHGVWYPWQKWLREISAIVFLPAGCFLGGWLYGVFSSKSVNRILISYMAGALIYALISVFISHQPWWNLSQTFSHVLRVPWGEQQWLSTRAVEQRAFLSLAILPIVFVNLVRYRGFHWSTLCLGLAAASSGYYVGYTTQSRIGIFTLILSMIPCFWLFKPKILRRSLLLCALSAGLILVISGHVCDERVYLQSQFILHMPTALMGGRQLHFPYASCIPSEKLVFGSFEGSSAFTPHNLLLDIYNDAGLIPFSLFLAAIILLSVRLFRGFHQSLSLYGWSSTIALRFSIASVLVVQYLAQPFLYTDQLMFSLGFFFFGSMLFEFRDL